MIRVVHVRGSLWGIESSTYSKVLNQEAHDTPGLRWQGELKAWVGYADAVHVCAKRSHARGLRIYGMIEPPEVTGLLVAKKGLRPYQETGIDFLLGKSGEGCILADDLGLGKSAQATTAARALKQKTVIACPHLLKGVWTDAQEGELAKWWPAASVLSAAGTKPGPVDAEIDVVVCHYEILYAWVDQLIEWGARVLVLDEGQFLMGHDARRTKAAKKLAAVCSHRMMLTGTPINNRVKDLWAPMDVISPGRFGEKFFKFGLRYCAGHEEQIDVRVEGVKVQRRIWKFDGTSNVEELRERLAYSPTSRPWGCMLRRLKSEVNLELPARSRQILTLEVKREYVEPISGIRSDAILRHALDRAADGKYPQIIELAARHLEAGSSVVVGCHRKKIAELIADGLRGVCPDKRIEVSHGEIPLVKRQAIIKSKPDALVVTIDSTVAGINLSFANVGIVAELVWVPSSLIQWEGRFGREPGRNVLVQYAIARGTADDLIKRTVLAKLDTFQQAIGKSDDHLKEDLRGPATGGAAERMRRLYERMMAEDAA